MKRLLIVVAGLVVLGVLGFGALAAPFGVLWASAGFVDGGRGRP